MKVSFWGVRGSIPTSGPPTARYGGHTTCVCLESEGAKPLVFDLGTGARALGRKLVTDGATHVDVLLSHTHIDHIYALPYFDPMFSPSISVRIGLPASSDVDARKRIGNYVDGSLHPIRLDEMSDSLSFFAVKPGRPLSLGPHQIETMALIHPGGTVGYRVTKDQKTVCFITDTGPLSRPGQGIMVGDAPSGKEQDFLHLIRSADLLIMDATFTEEEYLEKMTWGHNYPEYIVAVAKAANVKKVALFHHSPDATDDDLDGLAARWCGHTQPVVMVSKEGMVVDLEG